MENNTINPKNYTIEELKTYLAVHREKAYRASQIMHWVYHSKSMGRDDFINVPLSVRELLDEDLCSLTLVREQVSETDGTRKWAFATKDGHIIESVFMKYKHGNSICISSQAGCRMGCSFCASTLDGLSRNLTPAEMMDQILLGMEISESPISHVVIMGTGEPFDNYDNLQTFLLNATDEKGLGLSRRHITVSTCGILDQMNAFVEEFPQVGLAISLHAPNDDIRKKVMPIALRYSIADICTWSQKYFKVTGRRITYEYALIHGVNDSLACAAELARLFRGRNVHVNLIPLNEVDETGLKGSNRKVAETFLKVLDDAGVQATIRRELGSDISAACGQLRLDAMQESNG
ncbi:MAG: 23S rRNA (adenine(2503)-C(2))-methyltransferase RlmN [Clostridiales Family XIII bacterium]|jgi:23S rRNA (adenine2503-C2)-methyltransferase|nr:23S rRNA (adenine(2503)-C(2))-methyltransferase RlmN [Clostridiales Family XIII bacterium]